MDESQFSGVKNMGVVCLLFETLHLSPITNHQSPVPPLRTHLGLGKEGILWFRNIVNVHHLNCSLLFGFNKQTNANHKLQHQQ